jgi:hypothetical protein
VAGLPTDRTCPSRVCPVRCPLAWMVSFIAASSNGERLVLRVHNERYDTVLKPP